MHMIRVSGLAEQYEGYGKFWGMTPTTNQVIT